MKLDALQLKQRNTFFAKFKEEEVTEILEHGLINRHREGTTIFMQGDPGEAMFIILTGEVEILLQEKEVEEVLAILSPGSVFGEGSFSSHSPRTAKAFATKDTYLYVITSDHLQKLYREKPQVTAKLLLELLKIVCERLKITNTRLSN